MSSFLRKGAAWPAVLALSGAPLPPGDPPPEPQHQGLAAASLGCPASANVPQPSGSWAIAKVKPTQLVSRPHPGKRGAGLAGQHPIRHFLLPTLSLSSELGQEEEEEEMGEYEMPSTRTFLQ